MVLTKLVHFIYKKKAQISGAFFTFEAILFQPFENRFGIQMAYENQFGFQMV
jgi:hypothetical protein